MRSSVAVCTSFLLASIVAQLAAGAPGRAKAPPLPKWPDAYHATGTILLPYGLIAEPFETWVDMKNGMSRIDTYNGLARIVNRGDMGDSGTLFKIVYMSTEEVISKMTCFKIPGFNDAPVVPQGVLPNISLYEYVGNITTKTGGVMNVYTSNFTMGQKNNFYQLVTDAKTDAPVSLIFKGYDRLFGSHYDVYIVHYATFDESVDPSVFDIQTNYTCQSFPGPGVSDPMGENLFFEFVGAQGYTSDHQMGRLESSFSDFKEKHGKSYGSSEEEEDRKSNFHQNYQYISSVNRANQGYQLSVNHLADLSSHELKRMRGYRHTEPTNCSAYQPETSGSGVASSIDWQLLGAVTRVKDQGICGSCWSFGTTGTLEGSYFIKNGQLIDFSEQAFVDCTWDYGNDGCDGGESERAYNWAIKNKCIASTQLYGPYLMQDGFCKLGTGYNPCVASITKCYNTQQGNETQLKVAIFEKGPISVAIDASHLSFAFYSSGVYYESNCGNDPDSLDHQVLAVGYGTLGGKDYWLIKNSWSNYWGMDGYILMSRNRGNNCGVATDPSFADIE